MCVGAVELNVIKNRKRFSTLCVKPRLLAGHFKEKNITVRLSAHGQEENEVTLSGILHKFVCSL